MSGIAGAGVTTSDFSPALPPSGKTVGLGEGSRETEGISELQNLGFFAMFPKHISFVGAEVVVEEKGISDTKA